MIIIATIILPTTIMAADIVTTRLTSPQPVADVRRNTIGPFGPGAG
jgi:hypothetical protein